MSRPSERALGAAEELLDYVHPGMTRAAAIHEIAMLLDEMNSELMDVVSALVEEAKPGETGRQAMLLNHLREILSDYKPLRYEAEGQHELFPAATQTTTGTATAAGQMP